MSFLTTGKCWPGVVYLLSTAGLWPKNALFYGISWFDGRVPKRFLFLVSCGVFNSGCRERPRRLGAGRRQREFSKQREFKGVRACDGRSRLSRICYRSSSLRNDGLHLHGNHGRSRAAVEGIGPGTFASGPLWATEPGVAFRPRIGPAISDIDEREYSAAMFSSGGRGSRDRFR